MNEVGNQVTPRFPFRDLGIFTALGELRAIFGIHIAQLAVKYGIDVEYELASILPIEDEETKSFKVERKKK
jgi:hypothetical protein